MGREDKAGENKCILELKLWVISHGVHGAMQAIRLGTTSVSFVRNAFFFSRSTRCEAVVPAIPYNFLLKTGLYLYPLMQWPKLRPVLISGLILCSASAIAGAKLPVSGKHRIHYIGIGQDLLFTLEGEPYYSPYSCSDVQRVSAHLKKKASGRDSFYAYESCGMRSKKALLNTFLEVNRNSRSDDYFVFYYGGYTHKVRRGDQVITAFFISPPTFENVDDTLQGIDSNLYFTIADLRLWMNALPPRQQMVLIEAGFTNELKKEFSRMLVEGDALTGILEKRNRILIFPQGMGIEDGRLKSGRFTWTMTNGLDTTGWHLLDVFDPKRTEEFEFACWRSYVGVNRDGINAGKGINLIKEWELQELLSPTNVSGQVAMRGDNIAVRPQNTTSVVMDSVPRFYAFLCATNQYKYWDPLSNPVLDARTLAAVLRDKYGFHVKLIINPGTMEEFRSELRHFTDSIQFGPRDELLVFIAGHGQYIDLDNAGYIAFGNSAKHKVSEMQEQRNLVNLLDNRPCKKIMLIMDVCFGGMISQGLVAQSDPRLCNPAGSVPRGVWPFTCSNPDQVMKYLNCANRVYLTSGGYEYVSDGTPGAHSPFARALIDALDKAEDDFVLADEVITKVKKNIKNPPGSSQMPTSGRFGMDNNSTDFVFVRKNSSLPR